MEKEVPGAGRNGERVAIAQHGRHDDGKLVVFCHGGPVPGMGQYTFLKRQNGANPQAEANTKVRWPV